MLLMLLLLLLPQLKLSNPPPQLSDIQGRVWQVMHREHQAHAPRQSFIYKPSSPSHY
jgi:hypothetical protein